MSDTEKMSYRLQPADGGMAAAGAEAKTVLVVDDYRTIGDMTAAMLGSQGYRVLTATSGKEAQALAEKHPRIDLLLTDIEMPYMRGDELAAWFRSARAETRILFMSSERATGHALSAVPFLQKPFGVEALIGKVHEVLNHHCPSDNPNA